MGRDRRRRQEAQCRGDDARATAGQRRLPDQGVRGRSHHRLRTREGLLGQGPQRQCRTRQLRRTALRVLPRLDRRARSIQGRQRRLALREQRQELGDRLRFPCPQGRPGGDRGIPAAQPRRDAGLRVQHQAREIQGCAAAARVQLRLRFRGDEQADLLRPIQPHQQLLLRHRACLFRTARGAGARDPREGARPGAARSLHQGLYQPCQRQP